jgi:hypothetical protein
MSDEETKLPIEVDPQRYGETLLYDYSKFVTTLSLIALGGVLTLTQAAGPGELKPYNIGLVLGSIMIGGVLALSTANALVDARSSGKEPSKWLPGLIKASMAFIGIGLGAFLYMWWDALR